VKILIRSFDFSDSLGIMFYEEYPDGTRAYAKPIELHFEKIDKRKLGSHREPTLLLPNFSGGEDTIAVDMMKQLHALGVKLPEKKYLEGRIEQMEKHLEDMRKLVFGDE